MRIHSTPIQHRFGTTHSVTRPVIQTQQQANDLAAELLQTVSDLPSLGFDAPPSQESALSSVYMTQSLLSLPGNTTGIILGLCPQAQIQQSPHAPCLEILQTADLDLVLVHPDRTQHGAFEISAPALKAKAKQLAEQAQQEIISKGHEPHEGGAVMSFIRQSPLLH